MATRSYSGIGPVPVEALARIADGGEGAMAAVEEVTQFLEKLRDVQARIISGGLVTTGAGGVSSPAPAPTPGPPGPPGPPPAPPAPDLTPPPTPSGVVVSAGLDFVFIQTDAPTFTQGRGYNRTLVYGASYGGSGPLPTFGDAVIVHELVGTVGSFATPPGTQWHIWVKWRTNDGVLSVSPAGGANGYQVTTSLIGGIHLGPLIVEAANLAAGAVTTAKFAAGIEPVSIVSALPNPVGYTGPRTVFLTTDGKLYRYVAGAWTTAVAAPDITGQITTTQITPGAITTPLLAAGAVTAATIAANSITANEIAANAITASELAANSVVAGKIAAAAISATEIAAGQIQATHLAANSIAVGTLAVQNGAIVNAMIGTAAITDAKIVSLSATKLTAGTLAVGEYIQSSDFVSGVSGYRWSGNTGEVGSTMIRGLLTASQIDTRNLDIRDGAGTVIFSAGQNLDYARVAGLSKPKQYRVTSVGYNVVTAPSAFGLYDLDATTTLATGYWYMVARFSRSTGAFIAAAQFDVYLATPGADAAAMAAHLNARPNTEIVVVWTFDEPQTNRLTGGLPAAMYRCGASPGVFGKLAFGFRAAYVLIGIPGMGSGNGFEAHAGNGDSDPNAWCDVSFTIQNGLYNIGAAPAQHVIDAGNISTYIANAAIGTAQIGTLNASVITAGTITTDRLVVNAATANAASDVSFSGTAFGPATFVTSTNTAVVPLTTSGAAITAHGTVDVVITATSGLVEYALATVYLTRDAVTLDAGIADVPIHQFPVAGPARRMAARFPLTRRAATTAAAHTWGYYISINFYDAGGSLVSCSGTWSATANIAVQENKV